VIDSGKEPSSRETILSRILLVNPPVLAVDLPQLDLYAEAHPYGLLQIGAWLRKKGHEVHFVDLAGYGINVAGDTVHVLGCSPASVDRQVGARHNVTDKLSSLQDDQLTFWRELPAGNNQVQDVRLRTYWYGKPLAESEERLRRIGTPDEVYVTCTLNFNRQPAFEVISLIKKLFPGVKIRFGGNYPTACPEDAAASGADDIFRGRIREADNLLPAFDLSASAPKIGLFRLSNGCRYKCSFCINAGDREEIFYPVPLVLDYIREMGERYHLRVFSNWDPNIMLFPEILNEFLEGAARELPNFRFKFEMGVQPPALTRTLLQRMKSAGVTTMTVPVESVDTKSLRMMRKHYSPISSFKALHLAGELGFDLHNFHCTFIIGFPYDNLRSIFRTYHAISYLGGLPCPFPITILPGSLEFKRCSDLLVNKCLDEHNGHLWPLLGSKEDIFLYGNLLNILYLPAGRLRDAYFEQLPTKVQDTFFQELETAEEFVAQCLEVRDIHRNLERINTEIDTLHRQTANKKPVARSRHSPLLNALAETGKRIPEGLRIFDIMLYSSTKPDFWEYSVKVGDNLFPWREGFYYDVQGKDPEVVQRVNLGFSRLCRRLRIPGIEAFHEWLHGDFVTSDDISQLVLATDQRTDARESRYKYYLIPRRRSERYLEALANIFPLQRIPSQADLSNIYIIGIDFTSSGFLDIKLYFALDEERMPRVVGNLSDIKFIFDEANFFVYQLSVNNPSKRQIIFQFSDPAILEKFIHEKSMNSPSVGELSKQIDNMNEYLNNNEINLSINGHFNSPENDQRKTGLTVPNTGRPCAGADYRLRPRIVAFNYHRGILDLKSFNVYYHQISNRHDKKNTPIRGVVQS
jgi:hypothetical protein